MKKTLLLKSLLLLCALIVGSSSLWAADVTGTINFGPTSGSTSINKDSVTGDDDQGNKWTITTVGTTSFTNTGSNTYSQVGSSNKPATSITFTTTLSEDVNITAFSAKFGGFNGTAGTVTLKVGDTTVGTGSLNATSDVTVSASSAQTGKVLTVTVTGISKGVKVYYISYTYSTGGGTPTVNAPTFNVGTGTYTSAQSVELGCATEDATIYYTVTTDGTTPDDPTEEDDEYTDAIPVTISGTIIKARAFRDGYNSSTVATATYTIKPNTPSISALGATITISGDAGCSFYYTTDETTPSNSSSEYSGSFNLSEDCIIKAIAYDTYGNASGVKSYTFKYMPLSPKNINSGYYKKVTDVSTLENGDAILIVNETNKAAMSTTQNTNNRGEADVTISDGIIKNPSASVQKLILVKKIEKVNDEDTDVFYFYTGNDGYLYAASSSSNYLKTQDPATTNARATISISSGNASILFRGSYTHNKVQYNSSSSLFSCYSSDQAAVQIYKEDTAEPSAGTDDGAGHLTLTTSDNMDGWRAFYDASQDYTVDTKTRIYVAKAKSATSGEVELTALDATAIPHGEAVILKTSDADHSMTLTETTGVTTLGTNLLEVTDGSNNVDGYRLGYGNIGGEDAVGFFKYTTTTAPAAGIVYIDKSNVNISVGAHGLTISFTDNETTAIKTVNTENLTTVSRKLMKDGRIIIESVKGTFTLSGTRMK